MNENDLSDGNWFFYGRTTGDQSHLHSINEHFNQSNHSPERTSVNLSFPASFFSEYNVVISLLKKKKKKPVIQRNLIF